MSLNAPLPLVGVVGYTVLTLFASVNVIVSVSLWFGAPVPPGPLGLDRREHNHCW
jgi:hypothetical protein